MLDMIGYYLFYYVAGVLFWIALGASFWWSGRRKLSGRSPEDIPFRVCQFTGPFVTVIGIAITILMPPSGARGAAAFLLTLGACIPSLMAYLLISIWRLLRRV